MLKILQRLRHRKPKERRAILGIAAILVFIVIWSAVVIAYGPQQIVEFIGTEQSYIFAFLVSAFGGLSSISSASFYLTIGTLAVAGLNPVLLGIFAGCGLTIGDSLFFALGSQTKDVLKGRFADFQLKIARWIGKRPPQLIPVLIFVYCGFTPFPNDLLTISLGISGYPLRRAVPPILLGNIVLSILYSYLAAMGVSFFAA